MNLKQFLDLCLQLGICSKIDDGKEGFEYDFRIEDNHSTYLPFEQIHMLRELFDGHWKIQFYKDEQDDLYVGFIWRKNPEK